MQHRPMPSDCHFETSVRENTVVAIWMGEPTAERLSAMVEQLRAVWRQYQNGVYLLNVITKDTGIPDGDTRRTIAAQFESMRDRLKASAIVLEKSGVDGTLSRTILSTLVTISRRPFEMKIFSSREAAAAWLTTRGAAPTQVLTTEMAALERALTARARTSGRNEIPRK